MTEVIAVEVSTTSSKPRNGATLINIVLDETGSMNSCWDATISSFNEYIGSQKTTEGDCSVSLYTFSTLGRYGGTIMRSAIDMNQTMQKARDSGNDIRPVFENVPVQDVGLLTRENYRPNGGTNLYDAIGATIRNVESQLSGKESVPDVLVVIITDGEENASTEYRLDDIRKLIAAKEQEGWTFIYLGANQDAWQVGASFGLAKGQTMTYNTDEMIETMNVLADATTSYRNLRSSGAVASGTVSRNFFDPKAGA